MDEDELLYREMNPEDPWYMGVDPDEEYEEEEFDDEEECSRRNSFLLFWNPRNKSCKFSLEDYANARQQYGKRFTLNKWPIDWPDNVIVGDRYYMVKVDGKSTGIVWHGTFASEPYIDKGRNGRGKQCYVDINVEDAIKPDTHPLVPLSEMQELNTEENWERLKSGQMISPEMADRFDEIVRKKRFKESYPYKGYTSKDAYEKEQNKQFRSDMIGCIVLILLFILGVIAFAAL